MGYYSYTFKHVKKNVQHSYLFVFSQMRVDPRLLRSGLQQK